MKCSNQSLFVYMWHRLKVNRFIGILSYCLKANDGNNIFCRFLLIGFTLLIVIQVSPVMAGEQQITSYQINGLNIPHQLDDGRLVLHGAGSRSVFYKDVYSVALYTEKENLSASEIINTNSPVLVRLYVTSSLVTRDRFRKQTRESMKRVGKLSPDTSHVDVEGLLNSFEGDFSVGDIWDINYEPTTQEISIYRNNGLVRTMIGEDLRQALLKVWISEKPIQKSLKYALLAGDFD